MDRWLSVLMRAAAIALLSGCRTSTHLAHVPRVDLELDQGNRGYFVGHPSGAADRKTTRQMIETNVELPSFYQPTRVGTPTILERIGPPSETLPASPSAPTREESYTAQPGDSLWSIAAKPEIYGSAIHWRRLFDANRDVLKSPDRLRAGMTLKIPRGKEPLPSTRGPTAEDAGTTFKK